MYVLHACKISRWSKINSYVINQLFKFKFLQFKIIHKRWIYGLNDVDAHFEAQQQEKAQQYGQRRVSGWLEEPFSLDGRSSGS